MKVSDFAPFRRSYVREFELSHSNLVNRIIKITHAHNLHVKMLQNFLKRFEEITSALLQHLQLNYVSCKVKVDSLTFINFQENYQTAEIYFYLYHDYCVN